MLIEFSVTNFRSFSSTQTLSMAASTATELQETNTFPSPVAEGQNLLRSAVLYGPNAAGKSNLIKAMATMRDFVLSSANGSQTGEKVPVIPFLFNDEGRQAPSEFEVHFVRDNVRYQYGFTATADRVMHEWLLAYPEGRGQRWFERDYDPVSGDEQWYFGPKFTGRRKVWQEATRSNALFLSTAVQLNNEQLKPLFDWFRALTIIGQGTFLIPQFTISQCEDMEKKAKILRFLHAADPNISDIQIKKEAFDARTLPASMPMSLRAEIEKDMSGKELTLVYLLHSSGDKRDPVPLELAEESDGTKKLFAYAAPWLALLEDGNVLFIDELNNSLHPLLVRYLINLLHNSKSNPRNAQLIVTTHDTSLLDQELLRRDQVWFVEKDAKSLTHLYPLSDFSPRKGEALEKGYLHGRYGALPYIEGSRS
jgi:hypothetical protein